MDGFCLQCTRAYSMHCVFPFFVSNGVLDSEVWCLLLQEWRLVFRSMDGQTDIEDTTIWSNQKMVDILTLQLRLQD